jgi:hypothetical protein
VAIKTGTAKRPMNTMPVQPANEPIPDPGVAGAPPAPQPDRAAEIGGRDGPDPTRYGDWEKNGRCIDF